MKNIYWFKRDLRVEDNRALNKCLEESNEVYPIFIFNENILKKLNSFDNRLYFLKSIIENLKNKINLNIFYGRDLEIFDYLIKEIKPEKIYTSEALSWEGKERNLKIKKLCKEKGVDFVEIFDNFLVDVRKIEYTKIYSYFYKKWINLIDNEVEKLNIDLNFKTKILKHHKFQLPDFIINVKNTPDFYWTLNFLKERIKNFDFKNYDLKRNYLEEDGTSKLSPYIRFGVISIREIYNKFKLNENFIKELAWREFWYHIKNYFPELKNLEFQEKRRGLKWENNQYFIEKFEKGETGYPIIDAAIRQLKQENWMHNRARMIVGSFLTKDLLIDWRIGEKFFSKYLIDYDEVINAGNWQWVASVGPDPRILRIFNPVLQAKKFDSNCSYIKKYIPELKNVNCKNLINPIDFNIKNYYKIIVNHFKQSKKVKQIFYDKQI